MLRQYHSTLVLGPVSTTSDILEVGIAMRSNRVTRTIVLKSGGRIGDDGMLPIAKALRTNFALHSLIIQQNDVGHEGVRHLAESLRKHNYGLQMLMLEDNRVGDKGLLHLCVAMKDYWFYKYGKLTKLVLTRADISDEVCDHLSSLITVSLILFPYNRFSHPLLL